MFSLVKIIYESSKKVLSIRKYLKMFSIISLILFLLLVFLPVFGISENDIFTQLKILSLENYLLMIFLSVSMGLMFTMQIYSNRIKKSLSRVSEGVVSGTSGIIAGIFGTAACSSCLAAIFGFLGFGTIIFLLEYKKYVVGVSVLLIYISIYFASKNINHNCDTCR